MLLAFRLAWSTKTKNSILKVEMKRSCSGREPFFTELNLRTIRPVSRGLDGPRSLVEIVETVVLYLA